MVGNIGELILDVNWKLCSFKSYDLLESSIEVHYAIQGSKVSVRNRNPLIDFVFLVPELSLAGVLGLTPGIWEFC